MLDALEALSMAFDRRWASSVVHSDDLASMGDPDYLHEMASNLEPLNFSSVVEESYFYLRSGSRVIVRKLKFSGGHQPEADDLAWMVEAGERDPGSAPGLIWVKSIGDTPYGAGETTTVIHAYLMDSSTEILYEPFVVTPWDGDAEEPDDLQDQEQAVLFEALTDFVRQ